jgi:hypothetical protein
MLFYPSDAVVPTELRTDDLLLRMLRASDVELDYDAVISSREILLLHSGGRWPRERRPHHTMALQISCMQPAVP